MVWECPVGNLGGMSPRDIPALCCRLQGGEISSEQSKKTLVPAQISERWQLLHSDCPRPGRRSQARRRRVLYIWVRMGLGCDEAGLPACVPLQEHLGQ